jgi:hypothetical protein
MTRAGRASPLPAATPRKLEKLQSSIAPSIAPTPPRKLQSSVTPPHQRPTAAARAAAGRVVVEDSETHATHGTWRESVFPPAVLGKHASGKPPTRSDALQLARWLDAALAAAEESPEAYLDVAGSGVIIEPGCVRAPSIFDFCFDF